MICAVYLITATHPQGIDFWKNPLAQLFPGDLVLRAAQWLDHIVGLKGEMSLAGLPTNVAFMMIGAFGTFGNILNR